MAAKGKAADFDDIGADRPALKSFDWEVADINFGKTDMGYVEYLNKLADLRVKFIANKHRLAKADEKFRDTPEGDKIRKQVSKDQEALQRQWSTVLDSYKAAHELCCNMKSKDGGEGDDAAARPGNKDASVRFAYVVFRSMNAMEHVLAAYNVGTCKRWCTMSCGCCCRAK